GMSAGNSTVFFQAEDGIRDFHVTGVQTCALPIFILIALHKPKAFQISSFFETPYCYIIVILVTHQKPNITILIHLKQFLNRPWRSEERRVGKECRATW